jgi:transposase
MSWIKKGTDFLPHVSTEELKKVYKKEKNAKAKLRLLAALRRKDGETLESIAFSLEKPKITIHDWLKRFEQGGLNKIHDTKQPGKPSRLSKSQLKELDKVLDSSPQKQNLPFTLWTTKLVQYVIFKLFNVKYELWNIRKIAHKLGFAFKVPRQQHRKANKKAQEKFKKNLKQTYNITLNLDSRSSVLTKLTSS